MNTSVPLNFKDKCPAILRPRPSMLKFLFTHYAFEHWSKVIKYRIRQNFRGFVANRESFPLESFAV